MTAPLTAREPFYKTTVHWKTNYDHSIESSNFAKTQKGKRPEWSFPKTAYVSSRGVYSTEHESRFGKYGDNPREKLPSTTTATPSSAGENM